jgi:hypothetical protein
MLEKHLQTKIKKHLEKYHNAYVIKGEVNNNRATPDLICCINGKFVAIEVKQKGKKPRINQEIIINSILKKGGISFYVDSIEMLYNKLSYYNLLPSTNI